VLDGVTVIRDRISDTSPSTLHLNVYFNKSPFTSASIHDQPESSFHVSVSRNPDAERPEEVDYCFIHPTAVPKEQIESIALDPSQRERVRLAIDAQFKGQLQPVEIDI
jgi:hypothetical protein